MRPCPTSAARSTTSTSISPPSAGWQRMVRSVIAKIELTDLFRDFFEVLQIARPRCRFPDLTQHAGVGDVLLADRPREEGAAGQDLVSSTHTTRAEANGREVSNHEGGGKWDANTHGGVVVPWGLSSHATQPRQTSVRDTPPCVSTAGVARST